MFVSVKASSIEWSPDELQLLIKAVKTFPAGTNQRWEVVTEFINQHTKTPGINNNIFFKRMRKWFK